MGKYNPMLQALHCFRTVKCADGWYRLQVNLTGEFLPKAFHTKGAALKHLKWEYGGGREEAVEHKKWWNARPEFTAKVIQTIHKMAELEDANDLTMDDIFKHTKSMALKHGITSYGRPQWNFLVNHGRGNFMDWYNETYNESED